MNRIKELRIEKGMSQDDLAAKLGISRQAVSNYERGLRGPDFEALDTMSILFNARFEYILGRTDERGRKEKSYSQKDVPGVASDNVNIGYQSSRVIPVLGTISADSPLYADQYIEGYMTTDILGSGEYFGLKVKGDSMNAAQICAGNIIIVRKQDVVKNNDIAVVLVNGDEATVKRWHKEGDTVQLIPQSFNSENRIQMYDARKIPIKILGKVIKNIIEFE